MAEFNRLAALQQAITEVCDKAYTPHISVNTNYPGYIGIEGTDGTESLSISGNAVKYYQLDKDGMSFEMGIRGNPVNVFIPIGAILAVYPKENPSLGVGFPVELTHEEEIVAQIAFHEACIKTLVHELHGEGNPTRVGEPTPIKKSWVGSPPDPDAPRGVPGWKPTLVK